MHAGTYTSQLAEMVPPSTFYAQLEQYQKESKSTDVFVLNVSDLLPVLMAAELIMRYCWSRAEFERAPSLAVAQSNALTAWAAREYTDGNDTTAAQITLLLERYYGTSVHDIVICTGTVDCTAVLPKPSVSWCQQPSDLCFLRRAGAGARGENLVAPSWHNHRRRCVADESHASNVLVCDERNSEWR
jgi:hypothetical protein